MSLIYLVTMYRFGDLNSTSYVLGAFTKFSLAEKVALREEQDRSDYSARILELTPLNTEAPEDEIPLCVVHELGDEFQILYEEVTWDR